MRGLTAVVPAAALAAAAGCAGSPATPTAPSAQTTGALDLAVDTVALQAFADTRLAPPTGSPVTFNNPMTTACANGGSTTVHIEPTPTLPSGTFTSTLRIEYRDCNMGGCRPTAPHR